MEGSWRGEQFPEGVETRKGEEQEPMLAPEQKRTWSRSRAILALTVMCAAAACVALALGQRGKVFVPFDAAQVEQAHSTAAAAEGVQTLEPVFEQLMGGSSAGDALPSAGLACLGMAATAPEVAITPLAVAGIGACGAAAVGGAVLQQHEQSDNETSEKEVMDTVHRSFGRLDAELRLRGQHISKVVEEGTEEVLGSLQHFQQLYSCDGVSSFEKDFRSIHLAFKMSVFYAHLADLGRSWYADQDTFKAKLDFRQFVRKLKDCFPKAAYEAVMRHKVAFLQARSELFAMQATFCKLPVARGERRCGKEERGALASELGSDMRGYSEVLQQNCVLPIAKGTKRCELPKSCFGDESLLPEALLPQLVPCPSERCPSHLSELPEGQVRCECKRHGSVEVSLAELPRSLEHADFHSAEGITGDLADLPRGLKHADFRWAKDIKGEVADLPRGLKYADFYSAKLITGDLADLPRGLTHADFAWAEGVKGDLADLPRGLTHAYFQLAYGIEGDVADAPPGLEKGYFDGSQLTNRSGHVLPDDGVFFYHKPWGWS